MKDDYFGFLVPSDYQIKGLSSTPKKTKCPFAVGLGCAASAARSGSVSFDKGAKHLFDGLLV